MIKKLLYGIIIGILSILGIYQFCTLNIISGLLMCTVILFFLPSFRNSKIYQRFPRLIAFILPILLFFVSIMTTATTSLTTEQLIENELNSALNLVGDKTAVYKGLEYTVNSGLDNENDVYYLVDNQHYPNVQFGILKEDKDFQNYDSSKLEKEIKTFIKSGESLGDISNFSFKKSEIEGKECFISSYLISITDSRKELLSKALRVKAIHIPTSSGVYNISFLTYKEDNNDYEFDQWLDSFKLDSLYNYTDGLKQNREEEAKKIEAEKEKQKQLEVLKSEVINIKCNGNANEQEQQIFDTRKQDILTLIENDASIEEISNAKLLLEQTNTDIQARIDREEAERAAAQQAAKEREAQSSSSNGNSSSYQESNDAGIRGGYYCVDGTYVGNANPHARGKANACYGHGGFQVNH